MRIEEESPITRYLVNSLRSLTEADPALLANYVVALLKNNKPKKELQKLCVDKLYDFLGDGTKCFVTKLFHALEDGSIPTSIKEIEGTELKEATIAVVSGGPTELRSSSPQPERLPSAAVCALNEKEEKEISDDEDDDRNHKHKRRVTRSQSFDPDGQSDDERRPNKKRGRHSDNDQPLQESKLQFSDHRREYTSSQPERDISVKNDRKRYVSSPSSRLNVDGGYKAARGSQTYRNESAGRFDGQNFFARSGLGRGRGRNTGAWAPHDSRFTSVETVDFTSAIPPQGTSSANLYSVTGRPIPNTVNSANSSWTPLGMIPGIPSGGIEQLHPMHARMQGGRGTTLNATIGIGMGMVRPRCRDFEERGFCLRGDMCPMEHGLHRIVVEDVQSLSQFNLPVSLPGGHLLGIKSGAVGGLSSAVVSSPAPSSKTLFSKNTKYRSNEDTAHLNGITITSTENEPDFYDPDQPLWDKDRPNSSHGLMQLPSPGKGEDEHLWNDNSSDRHSCRLSDGDNERPGKTLGTAIGSHDMVPSVWGRLGPVDHDVNKSGLKRKGDIPNEVVQTGKPHKHVYDEQQSYGRGSVHQGNCDIETEGYENTALKRAKIPFQQGKVEGSVNLGVHVESGSNLTSDLIARGNVPRGSRGKGTERALRTLFVNCIPFQSNKRDLLLSHFQKFGEVLDIHIPKNSERAFVQFCQRESAEAALASPDAVMGNRFIRLSWANRDSILAGGESSATTDHPGKIASGGTSDAQPQQLLAGKRKQKVNDVSPIVSGISTLEQPPMETGGLKAVTTNDISNPSIPMVQKRQEKLELLEEIRRKQEMLAQKRDNFRRQLDKLARQGTVSRLDALDRNQGGKQQKTDQTAESPCTDPAPGGDNSVVKENFGDVQNQIAGSSLSPATLTHLSPKAFKAPFMRFPRSATAPVFNPNRFKLDNRPTAFKVLTPLPSSLMDISAMKEHFATFGGLSSVEFDDGEGHDGEASKTEKFSVRVTYTTRRAAERAFSHGKTWQGQNLQFAWVMPLNNVVSHGSLDNASCQTSKGFENGAIATETEVHDQPQAFEKESSGLIALVENEASDSKEARVNGVRNDDSIAEVSREGCVHQLKNLNDEVSQSDAECSSTQSHTASAASKLDGSSGNISSFTQTDIPTEVP